MEDRIPAALQFNSDSVPWKSIPAIIAELRIHWARKEWEGEEQHLQFLCILNQFLCPFDASEEKDLLNASRFFKKEGGVPPITGAGSRQNLPKCIATLSGLLLAANEFLIREGWGTLLETHLATANSAKSLSSSHSIDSNKVVILIFRVYREHSKAFAAAVLSVLNSPIKLQSVLALDISSSFREPVLQFFGSLCTQQATALVGEDDGWCQLFGEIIEGREKLINSIALACHQRGSDLKTATGRIVDQINGCFHCIGELFNAALGLGKVQYATSYCKVFLRGFPKNDTLNDLLHSDDVIMETCFSALSSCVSSNKMGDDVASTNSENICDDHLSAALTCFKRFWQQLLVAEPKDWPRIERSVVFLADLASKASEQATLRLIQQASLIEIVRQAWFIKGSTMKIQSEISFLLSNVLASVDGRQARNIFDEETGIPISEILQRPTKARVTSGEKLDLMYVIDYLLKPFPNGILKIPYFATPTALFAVIEACSGSWVEKRQLNDLRESLYVISVVLKMNVTSYDFMWLLLFGSNASSISASGASLQSSLDKLTTAEQKIHSLYPWLERVRTYSTLEKQDITDIDVLESLVTRFRKTISSCRALVKFIRNGGFQIRSQMDKSRAKKRQNIVQMCWECANQEQIVNKDEDVEKKRRDCKKVLNGLSDRELRVLFTERFNSNCKVPEPESHERYLVNLSRAIAFDVSVRTESLNEGRTEKIATEEIVLQMCEPLLINKEILEKKILGLKNVSPGTEWQTPVNFREVFSKEGQKLLQQLADLCQRKRQQRIRKRGLGAGLRFPLEDSLSFVMFLCLGIKLDELKWLA